MASNLQPIILSSSSFNTSETIKWRSLFTGAVAVHFDSSNFFGFIWLMSHAPLLLISEELLVSEEVDNDFLPVSGKRYLANKV